MSLPSYAVNFRGHPACPCQVDWIPVYERRLELLGIISDPLPIAQLIGFFGGSGGTHALGGDSDFMLTGHTADRAVAVARDMGADATWHRLHGWDHSDPSGGVEHVHSGLRGCPHMSAAAAAQIWAVDHDGDGLVGDAPDPGPRPLSGRTWQEGITWALQQEDEMADPATQQLLNNILAEAKATHAEVTALRGAEADRAQATRKRDVEIAAALDELGTAVASRAAKTQVQKIKQLLEVAP